MNFRTILFRYYFAAVFVCVRCWDCNLFKAITTTYLVRCTIRRPFIWTKTAEYLHNFGLIEENTLWRSIFFVEFFELKIPLKVTHPQVSLQKAVDLLKSNQIDWEYWTDSIESNWADRKMKIVVAALFLVSFAVISDASASAADASGLSNDGGILTPCGRYIPGKLKYIECQKHLQTLIHFHPDFRLIPFSIRKVQCNVFGILYSKEWEEICPTVLLATLGSCRLFCLTSIHQ